ncbi:hypothetical protein JCM10450v2_001733 [Rhodotorula kratochvilovae]
MAAEVGYHWPALAQQAFMEGTCRAGLSIGEWCSKAQDQCCGVICPNAPITGPATIIMNLLFVLIWKSESPYNLMVQLLATDGALAGLAVRTTTEQFRLSEIHAYFVPLAIMSIVPVAIAASTVEIEYFHGISYDGITALNAARYVNKQLAARASSGRPGVGNRAISAPVTKAEHVYLGFKGHRSKARATSEDRAKREEELQGKAMLPLVASIIFLIHVVAWFAIFVYVYVGFDKPAQANCSDELPIRQYKIVCASAVVAFFLIALIFWAALIGGLTVKHRRKGSKLAYRKDSLEYLAALTHWRKFMDAVAPSESSWSRSRELVRWGICGVIFWVWFAIYVAVYITMLQKFLLLGDNPFDWGQVTALGGVFVPALVVARAVFDNVDGWQRGPKTAKNWSRVAEVKETAKLAPLLPPGDDTAAPTDEEPTRPEPKKHTPKKHHRPPPPATTVLPGDPKFGSLDIDFSRVGSASRGSSFRSSKRRSRHDPDHDSLYDDPDVPAPLNWRKRDSPVVPGAGGVEEDLVDDGDPGQSNRPSHQHQHGHEHTPRRRASGRDKGLPPDPPNRWEYLPDGDPGLTALPPYHAPSTPRHVGYMMRKTSRRGRRQDDEGDEDEEEARRGRLRRKEDDEEERGEWKGREGKQPERRQTE